MKMNKLLRKALGAYYNATVKSVCIEPVGIRQHYVAGIYIVQHAKGFRLENKEFFIKKLGFIKGIQLLRLLDADYEEHYG